MSWKRCFGCTAGRIIRNLLTQQGIGQIVLSTHEETKAALLRYKFKRAGMSVLEQNMQSLYMRTVTEE